MRRPKKSEFILLFILFGIGLTLTIDPSLLANSTGALTDGKLAVFRTQNNLMWVSFALGIALFTSFYIRLTNVNIAILILSFAYLAIMTTSAIANYPNLLSVFMVGVLGFIVHDIFRMIDENEDEKQKKILSKHE
ncbi:hypothetical protein [Staphylococcus equorum]|uniref:hypothetical protein n=1 Tax=Staphylococcus equorum TaxID=246432 RepID=UPI00192CF255|nr:hypothetical protein [Staphylococcus equorum]